MQAMAEVEGNAFKTQEAQNLLRRDLTPLQEEVAKSKRLGGSITEEMNREDLFYRPPTNVDQMLTTQSLMLNSEDLLRESQA